MAIPRMTDNHVSLRTKDLVKLDRFNENVFYV